MAGSPRAYVTQGGAIQTMEGGSIGSIIVMGLVSSSILTNQIQFTGGQTIVNVLAMVGLPGQADWRQIRVLRRDTIDPRRKGRVIICDMWAFLALADFRQDIPLFPGDIVYVPQKWTLGDQWLKDWGLVKGLMGDALSIDGFIDAFKKDGAFRTP